MTIFFLGLALGVACGLIGGVMVGFIIMDRIVEAEIAAAFEQERA